MPRLLERYRQAIVPELMTRFGYRNRLGTPRLEKIVLNVGLGAAVQDASVLEVARQELALIAGQRPVVTKARKAIANFHIRKGQGIGLRVTLRGARMYEFLDRLVTAVLPRIRDFRGLPAGSFDGRGNYAFGIVEHAVFPEIDHAKVQRTFGMDVIVVTTAPNRDEGGALLRALGLPLRVS